MGAISHTEVTQHLQCLAQLSLDQLTHTPVLAVANHLPDDYTQHSTLVTEAKHLAEPSVHCACLLHWTAQLADQEQLQQDD